MEDRANQLKTSRTQSKTKVTICAKKLTAAISRNASKDCIENYCQELENAMAEFTIVHEDYCEVVTTNNLEAFKNVNGLNLKEYEKTVNDVYENAIEQLTGNKKTVITPLISRLDTSMKRLSHLCDKTKAFVEDKGMSPQLLESLNKQFFPLIEEIKDLMVKLSELQDNENFDKTKSAVSDLLTLSDSIQLDCSIAIHMCSNPTQLSSSSMSVNDQSVKTSMGSTATQSFQMHYSSPSSKLCNDSSSKEEGSENVQAAGKGDIQIKKISLPEFSGARKDWPEFKAIWRELAERAFSSKSALAFELKRSLKGTARDKVKNVYVTKPDAYETMWCRLSEYYDDVSAGVSAALDCLKRLKPVREEDYKGLVLLVDEVEGIHAQLEELGQVEIISTREIDAICELLPSATKMVWIREYHTFSVEEKVRPLFKFLKFLTNERASVARLAENQKTKSSRSTDTNVVSLGKSMQNNSNKPSCVVHKGENVKHKTVDCSDFKALSLDEKYQALRDVHACFRCFGFHRRDQCKSKIKCNVCHRTNHHTLMCKQDLAQNVSQVEGSRPTISSSSHLVKAPASISLYAIQSAFVVSGNGFANIFCDNGSNTSYITYKAADKLRAKILDKYTLDITTMGNVSREYDTRLYEVPIRTVRGEIVNVLAFGIDRITGPVSSLDLSCLSHIFPHRDVSILQRRSSSIDMLLGCDYFALHPKVEVCREGNLSIMQGDLGICVVGSHPDLVEGTEISCNMVKVVHDQRVKVYCNFVTQKQLLQPILSVSVVNSRSCDVNFLSRKFIEGANQFIAGEELATEADPKCGGCRCGKCPSVGHTYSFKEEQELKMIRDNLKYCEDESCWYTSYPWLVDPGQLPDNYNVALATLRNTERTLGKDPQWSVKYKEQIEDMLQRGVARKLSPKEIESWKGPKFYISHLAVSNPKSQSTPVRIVFNSSQNCNGVSLNSTLAKGPDGYMNNLLGLLLRWREEPIAVVGDIRKMFHSVKLELVEQHCHRFLWRDLDSSRDPDVYVMLRVNMGDTPAPAICTEALYKTAEMFGGGSLEAVHMITKSTYVDDIVDSFFDRGVAEKVTQKTEEILEKGGFHIKCWLFSGREESEAQLKSGGDVTRVLGVGWNSKEDQIQFQAILNFSPKKKGERTGPNLAIDDIPQLIPEKLTRRLVLEQVMMIFDPLGLLCPFTFIAKLYLRETWAIKLDWDDPLPSDLCSKWIVFFRKMFQVNDLAYQRVLRPSDAVGDPWLILLSDASDNAYGFAAYVRWKVSSGYLCRLVMAKCRIAPMRKLSTPQMELNAAVLSARARKVIEKEMRFQFAKVYHLVDSETVLNMINKTSTRFKVYEGVRIGEIQASTGGNMSEWAWLSGEQNTADWLTRGKDPNELGVESEWWRGPSVLYQESADWPIKFGLQHDSSLPGEKKLVSVSVAHSSVPCSLDVDYSRFGSIRRVFWVVARLLAIAKAKSFKGGNNVTPELLRKAEQLVVKDAQSSSVEEFSSAKGRYKALVPVVNSHGVWIIGKRLGKHNPMTPEGEAQALLPADHVVTQMLMRDAHVACCHRGRDSTLARFRCKYWTPHASKIAWSVRNSCQLCKLRDANFLQQEMGELPQSRLKPAPPFTNVMLDLFGPFKIRGEVQKRTTGKGYGVLFTDMTMRAVHIEGVFGYDTDSFLLAFSRFVSVRGWPETVYSDPGSQLVSVDKELKDAWVNVDRSHLSRKGAENGLTWVFGPADAPWYQGAVESLVKSVKRAFNFAFHGRKFSASEFLSVCYEISNVLNERPIGTLPSVDAEISVLTPNCLLMGRSTAQNPGGWQPNHNLLTKFSIVQDISNQFWQKWCELCAPALVIQRKWHTAHRNLQPGDVVIMADKNSLRGQYRIAMVKNVFPGSDGKVRRVSLTYKNFKVGEKVNHYSGVPDTEVTRSIQKLALLVPYNDK